MRSLLVPYQLRVFLLLVLFPISVAFPAEVFLTHGPLIGAVTATSVKIWLRTNIATTFQVEYGTSSTFLDSSLSEIALTAQDSDFTGQVKLQGLVPETTYFYRFWAEQSALSGVYRFTTAPRKSVLKDFSFAVLSDFRIERAPVYRTVALEDPAFIIFLGDFNHSTPSTLSKMRAMHRTMRGEESAAGQDFIAHIRPFPFYHVWDDHDFGADNADKTFVGKGEALKAFREYFATPFLSNTDGIWHRFRYAQAEIFMLDLRSQRDPSENADGPNKSMLGNAQKEWLKAALLNSTAQWKFLMSTVPFNPRAKPKDSWAAFQTERLEIIDFIQRHAIKGIIVISGDLHTGGALDNGVNSTFPEVSVPHANIPPCSSPTSCRCNTGGVSAGIWSEGILCGIGSPGYSLITVREKSAFLQIKGIDGLEKIHLEVLE